MEERRRAGLSGRADNGRPSLASEPDARASQPRRSEIGRPSLASETDPRESQTIARGGRATSEDPVEPAASAEPRQLARGTIFVGFRQAALELWGEAGLRTLAQKLPEQVRADTIDSVLVSSEWLPETHVLAWYEALWSGPCEGRRNSFIEVIDRMMDHGFGRVRKALLQLASPSVIFVKAPGLWRYDHSHGVLTVEAEARSARLRLENHPYTENPLSCLATAEIYRYCVALCRARDVTASHYREDSGSLVVRLRWL